MQVKWLKNTCGGVEFKQHCQHLLRMIQKSRIKSRGFLHKDNYDNNQILP